MANGPPNTGDIGAGPDPLGGTVELGQDTLAAMNQMYNQGSLAQSLGGLAGAAGVAGGSAFAAQRTGLIGEGGIAAKGGVKRAAFGVPKLILEQGEEGLKGMTDELEKLQINLGLSAQVDFKNLNKGIQESGVLLGQNAISLEDTVSGMADLVKQTPFLSKLLKEGGVEGEVLVGKMGAVAALWRARGVELADTSKLIEKVFRELVEGDASIGEMSDTFDQVTKAADGLANHLRTPLSDQVKALTSNLGDAAILGIDPFIKNISQLQILSMETGLSLEELFNISDRFKTLPSAADAVGDLSAVLRGTTLGVDQLLAAEPAERVKLVLEDIQAAISEGRFELAEGGQERIFQMEALAGSAGITAQQMNKIVMGEKAISEVMEESGKIRGRTAKEQSQALEGAQGASKAQKSILVGMRNQLVGNKDAVNDFTNAFKRGIRVIRKGITDKPDLMEAFADIAKNTAAMRVSIEAFSEKEPGVGLMGNIFFGSGHTAEDFLAIVQSTATSGQIIMAQLIASMEKVGGALGIPTGLSGGTPGTTVPNTPIGQGRDPLAGKPKPTASTAGGGAQKWSMSPNGALTGNVSIPISIENFGTFVKEQAGKGFTKEARGAVK